MTPPNFCGGNESLVFVIRRHLDVDDCDIREVQGDGAHQGLPVCGESRHGDSELPQQSSQALA
jgi:hypothetical protein